MRYAPAFGKLKCIIALLKVRSCLIFFCSLPLPFLAQQQFSVYEDSLVHLQKELYHSKTDKDKLLLNTRLKAMFERTLRLEGSFNFAFDSLREIGRIYSPDKTFRIINWDVLKEDASHEYYGFIQAYDEKHKRYNLYPLADKSADIKNPESTVGDMNKWYGMLYYKIIPITSNRKKYYTLFGLDPNDKLTTKKIIDILYFAPDGTPRFGADLFKMEKKFPKRVVFEYSADLVMSLKYNEAAKQIVFDHLSPSDSRFEGQFQYYGPDFSFDALEFKKGKWNYVSDIDARNGKSPGDNKYHDPKHTEKEHQNKKLYGPKK